MKCSIIVANYNNGRYLNTLINSVLNQTYDNWELIITDDCSTDNSLKIIQSFLRNEKIKLLKHKKNYGAAKAFSTCIENSDGEIIAMLGADDALKANAIKEIMQAHKKFPHASMIIANLIKCDSSLNPIGEYIKFPDIPKSQTVLIQFGLSGWDTFKRCFYDKTSGLDIEQKRAIDQDLYFKMEEVGTLQTLNKALYLYRSNADGISQQKNQSFAHEYNYLAIINAYKRRKKSGFKNISRNKYNEILKNYWHLKFFNDYKRKEYKLNKQKEIEVFDNYTKGIKPKNTEELKLIMQVLNSLNVYEQVLIKQKILQSFFIRKKYDLRTIKELFDKDLKPYTSIKLKTTIKIFIKSILLWKKK